MVRFFLAAAAAFLMFFFAAVLCLVLAFVGIELPPILEYRWRGRGLYKRESLGADSIFICP
jgi:hypothetical protein